MNWRVFVLVFLFPAFCFAQVPTIKSRPIETIPAGDDKIVPLPRGEKAPFTGQLYEPATALRWANWLGQYKLRLKEDLQLQQQMCQLDHDYQVSRLSLEKEAFERVETDLRTRVLNTEQMNLQLKEELLNAPWYNTRGFGVVIGVIATSLVFGLSVYAVDQLK